MTRNSSGYQLHVMVIYKQINLYLTEHDSVAFRISIATTTINDDANKIVIKLSNALRYGYLA